MANVSPQRALCRTRVPAWMGFGPWWSVLSPSPVLGCPVHTPSRAPSGVFPRRTPLPLCLTCPPDTGMSHVPILLLRPALPKGPLSEPGLQATVRPYRRPLLSPKTPRESACQPGAQLPGHGLYSPPAYHPRGLEWVNGRTQPSGPAHHCPQPRGRVLRHRAVPHAGRRPAHWPFAVSTRARARG